jgi:hypothetical protein
LRSRASFVGEEIGGPPDETDRFGAAPAPTLTRYTDRMAGKWSIAETRR